MKTIISCSLAGLALLANAANAGGMEGYGIPSNVSLYAGASAGMANHDGACSAANVSSNCDDSASGYKVFAGAKIAPQTGNYVVTPGGVMPSAALPTLGVEAGYMDLGGGSSDGKAGRANIYDAKSSSDLSASYLAGVGYMPVAPRTELLGKAGVAFWKQNGKREVPQDTDLNIETSNSGTGLLLGGGAQYQINENLSVRGEYEHVFGTAKDTPYESDAGLYSLGAVFSTL